jgi:hypothetical protein
MSGDGHDRDGRRRKNRIVGTGSITFEDSHREALHVHAGYAQLEWPTTGVASVRTPSGMREDVSVGRGTLEQAPGRARQRA